MSVIDLYLELLKKSLTDTLRAEEPDADDSNASAYVVDFVRHYIRGDAVTMLPMARLEVIRGAAHLPYMSHPDTFNALVASFLAQVDK